MKKKMIIGIIVLLLIFAWPFISYNRSTITGEEWLKKQETYLNDLKAFSETLDDVTSLYLIGSISYDDYKIHMKSIQDEFIILASSYKKERKSVHVKEGTYSREQKTAVENVKKCYDIMEKLVNVCINESSDKNVLSYKYLAAQQAVAKEISSYLTQFEN